MNPHPRRTPLRLGITAIVVVVASALVLPAAAGNVKGPPFKYVFKVTALDVDGTYTAHGSTASSHLHLDGSSKKKWISWFGPKPTLGPGTLISTAALYLTGQASYSSPDQSCASKFTYKSSRSHPVRAVFVLDTFTFKDLRIRVDVEKFPIARALPGQDSGGAFSGTGDRCGKAEVRWFDTAHAIVPASVLTNAQFAVVASRHETFEDDGEAIDWTMKLTVKRLRYHLINCATESGC